MPAIRWSSRTRGTSNRGSVSLERKPQVAYPSALSRAAGSYSFPAGRCGRLVAASSDGGTTVAQADAHDSNGSLPLQATDATLQQPAASSHAPDPSNDLRQQVEQLQQLVTAQQQLLAEQGSAVADLKSLVAAQSEQLTSQSQQLTPILGAPIPSMMRPFDAQRQGIGDRRFLGLFDARFHSTSSGATPKDFRVLPERIILVRHAESEGNVDNIAYTYIPDPQVPLTGRGKEQARQAGLKIQSIIDANSSAKEHRLFFYTSPYRRSLQTFEGISAALAGDAVSGVQEEVQLREQDFGNFQDAEGKKREKADRLRFGRFFYRFPNGESGADVYDRITIFEDHMIRDINAGRFSNSSSLVLVSHGLALRVFLMRWFHWTVDQFLNVYNPPNAEPLVLERVSNDYESRPGGPVSWIHTKALYTLTDESMDILKGCTSDMCSTSCVPRGHGTAVAHNKVSTRLL